MNTRPKKSRKTALLILGVIGLLVFLSVVLMRKESDSGILASSDTRHSFPNWRFRNDSVSPPVTSHTDEEHNAAFSSATADDSEASRDKSNGSSSPTETDSFVTTGLASTAFGVVDLEQLIAAHSSGADLQDTRAETIRDISRIVAMRARAHGFAFVLNISARNLNGTPFVLATNGVPDLTGEVLRELSR